MITYSPTKTDTHIYPVTGGGYSDTAINPFQMWSSPGAAVVNQTQPRLYDITRTISAEGTSVPLVYGRAQVGGRVFALDYNSTTKLWTVGYVVAMGEINSYVQVWMNGAAPVSGVLIDYYYGTGSEGINGKLQTAISGYADTMVVTHPEGNFGLAYIVIQYSDAHYEGWPTVVVEIEGKKVWNPKTSTTIYSENPALHLGDLLRSTVYGMGKTVDDTTLEAVQDYCDDTTPTEIRRTSYQVIDNPRSIESWIDVLRLYASCFIIYRDDTVYLLADKSGASVMTIGEDDIVAGSLSITKRDASELPTVIYAVYTDTTEDVWKERVCEPAKAAGVDDGTTPWREQRLNLVGVNRHSQANRECEERLRKLSLSDLAVSFSMFDEALELELGDIITVTHSYGLTSQTLRVIRDPIQTTPGRWRIETEEYNASVWSTSKKGATGYPAPVTPVNIVPKPPTNVLATEVTYQLANSEYASRLDITWTAAADSIVTGYNVTVKDGGSNVVWSTSTTGTEASTGPLLEGVTYTVEVTSFTPTQSSTADTDTELIDGLTATPNAPASLSGSNNDSTVYLYWPASTTNSVVRYEIRYYTTGQTWSAGTTLEIVDGLNFTTRAVANGTWRFGVKSINSVGTYSSVVREQDIVVAAAPAGGTYTTTYYAIDPPAANQIGDLWYDTNDGMHPYRANTAGSATQGAWDTVRDATIADAQADATQAIADALAAQTDATDALADALTANNAIADIADDNLLSVVEKSQVILQYDTIIAEQAGIDGEATSYGITTEKTAYDGSVTALTTYLGTLTSPVAWNNLTNHTTIVGTTFRSKFKDVYTDRQALLDAIAAAAKVLADDAQSDATQAIADAAGKAKVFYQSTIPTSISIGDLWVRDGSQNKLYRADSVGANQIITGEWELVQDTDIPQALSDAADAQTEAETKNTVFYATNAPTANKVGDIWVDTTNAIGYRTISYCTALPSSYTAAISGSTISAIEATADGKNTVYWASTAPTGGSYDDGDMWVNSTTKRISVRNAGAWQDAKDAAITTAQSTAESKAKVHYTGTAPTTTDAVGDIWIDTTNAEGYRDVKYATQANPAIWATAFDGGNVTTVESSVDGKSTIYYGTTTVGITGMDDGDLFINTTTGIKSVYETSAWVEYPEATDPLGTPTTEKTASFTAVAGERYPIDTSPSGANAAITMTLPASPSPKDVVFYFDSGAYFETNKLTIARNGKNIMSAADDLVIDVRHFSGGLFYVDATIGWHII